MSFQDIKIVGFNDERSKPSGNGALVFMHLQLSEVPITGWWHFFDMHWKQYFYSMKRKVQHSNDYLIVECMPDELQMHIDAINYVLRNVNDDYKKNLIEIEKNKNALKLQEEKRKEELSEIKKKLKF